MKKQKKKTACKEKRMKILYHIIKQLAYGILKYN